MNSSCMHIYSTLPTFLDKSHTACVTDKTSQKMSFWNSGVQRLLDARGQRGSWMPSKIVSIRLAKFLTIFFYLVTYQNLSLFRISCQISRKFAPWMPPPVLHHVPVTKFFSSFLVIYLHFFYKSWPLGCPPGWMPG